MRHSRHMIMDSMDDDHDNSPAPDPQQPPVPQKTTAKEPSKEKKEKRGIIYLSYIPEGKSRRVLNDVAHVCLYGRRFESTKRASPAQQIWRN